MKHIIVYSHGFGVRKDDRGLFTDIAAQFPNAVSVMFDYNEIDEVAQTLTAVPLAEQAKKLLSVINEIHQLHSNAIVDLICHSQGCVTAALARPAGIRKTILLAPPVRFSDTERVIKDYCIQRGIIFSKQKDTELVRRDKTKTIIPSDFWKIEHEVIPEEIYNNLAHTTDLIIMSATEDEILSSITFDQLSPNITCYELTTGHNFEGSSRTALTGLLSNVLSS